MITRDLADASGKFALCRPLCLIPAAIVGRGASLTPSQKLHSPRSPPTSALDQQKAGTRQT